MIIPNGTIEIKHKEERGIDPITGYPSTPTSVRWSRPIDCQYTTIKQNKLGKSNGESTTILSYSILIEKPSHPIKAEQVRLTDCYGEALGEYSIISIEPLDAVEQIRLII